MKTRVCPTCQGTGEILLTRPVGHYQICTVCLGSGVLYLTDETYNRVHARTATHRSSQPPTPTHTHPPPGRRD